MLSCSHSTGDQQYDQIAAALLNRYPSLMMEMNNVGQQGGGQARARAKEDGQASHSPLAGSAHKLPPSAHNQKVERRPPDPVPEKRPTEVTGHPWSTGTLGKPPARDSPRLNTPPGPEALTDPQSSQEKTSAPLQASTHITSNSLMPSTATLPATMPPISVSAPEATPRPLAHSVASQLQPPAGAVAFPPSVREDMQAGLKGLFKMQAEFQGKKNPEAQDEPEPAVVNDLNGGETRPGQQPSIPIMSQPVLHTPRSPPHPPPRSSTEVVHLPPALPPVPSSVPLPSEPPKVAKPSDPTSERMEIKNSGIPGPGAITWKRKSLEDLPTNNHVKAKKRKVDSLEGGVDPYSFDDDEVPDKKDPKACEANGADTEGSGLGSANIGPVYKYKSAMLSREVEKEEEREEVRNESDESSRSSNGGNLSPAKKKYKRPKLEEWSVAPKTPNSRPGDKNERSEKTEGGGVVAGPRKGPLWGLPILPKPPQKPEKPREVVKPVSTPVAPTPAAAGKVDVKNVWLQAFGAGNTSKAPSKPKKKNIESPTNTNNSMDQKKAVKPEREEKVAKTILDIPPEVRRKSRPTFGGLIHFSPDWVRSVRRHHERCRLPTALENSQQLNPKILVGQLTPKKSYEDFARKDMVSPPDLLAMERDRVAPTLTTMVPEPHPVPTTTQEDELPGQLPSIVESILANRKKLREAAKMGRMYKNPFTKEKKPKRMAQTEKAPDCLSMFGLLPTPGLPSLTEESKDEMVKKGFGDFRDYTLRNFLEPANDSKTPLKSPPSNKPRKAVNKAPLDPSTIKQIFGLEEEREVLPQPKQKIKVEKMDVLEKNVEKVEKKVEKLEKKVEKVDKKVETNGLEMPPVVTPKKEKKKKEAKTPTVMKPAPPAMPVKSNKFRPVLGKRVEPGKDDGSYSQEMGVALDRDNELQTELGGFALDLLDDNLSWAKQITIQNLVIWEPAETPIVIASKKKKGKKKRTRKSGLDFSAQKRKGKSSVNGSRATSPVPEGEPHEVKHSVDTIIAESNRWTHHKLTYMFNFFNTNFRWVVDKNAGETILHRASKMGYPDVVAYALDMAGMGAMDKDYAGLTPLHKAAFKGHHNNVRLLLKYGADPSAQVKGTRALHEGNPHWLDTLQMSV